MAAPTHPYPDPVAPVISRRRVKRLGVALLFIGFYIACLRLARVDPPRLLAGLPKMARWAAKAWPPETAGLDLLLLRAAETVAMAAVGTSIATVLALLVSGV